MNRFISHIAAKPNLRSSYVQLSRQEKKMRNILAKGFTLVELVVVIAILAILSGVALPLYSGYVRKAEDVEYIQNASVAYKEYILDNLLTSPEHLCFVYEGSPNKIAIIQNGAVGSELYPSFRQAVTALIDNPATSEDESLAYSIANTSTDKLYLVAEGISSDWSTASVVFVGDSITAGSGTSKTYYSYLNETMNFGSVTPLGIAGSCISSKSDYGSGNSPLIHRYSSIPDADLIIVFMGTNDYGHETPLGSITDSTDISFYGALDVIISGTQRNHPDSQLIFATPLHRYGFGTSKITGQSFTYDDIPNGRGHTLADYVNAIKSVCAKYEVPVIDLFTLCPIDPSNSSDRTTYFPDGLHPNAAGHEIIAETIAQNLQMIPNKNNHITDSNQNADGNHTASPAVPMQLGNKFVSEYSTDMTRASSVSNIYLTKGQIISFTGSQKYEWALAKTSGPATTDKTRYYPNNGWNTALSYTIEEDGYYGLVLKTTDQHKFDFINSDPDNLYSYILINS